MTAHVLQTALRVTERTAASEPEPRLVGAGMLFLPRIWVSLEIWGKPRQHGCVDGHGAGMHHCRPPFHSHGMSLPLMPCALFHWHVLYSVTKETHALHNMI